MNLSDYKKIHCIGIGGIGVSALARILIEFGRTVSGSDLVASEITASLQQLGALITIGKHKAATVAEDVDLIINSNAVEAGNPEMVRAKKLKIPVVSYPEFLGAFLESYIPLVVTGTHGKSTTTAMLASIFITAGFDPTVIVGTKIKECGNSNARLGLGRYCLVEGDEYKGAFLHYPPVGLIINNIEADHLDYYKDEEHIIQAFHRLARKVPSRGFIVANVQDENVLRAVRGLHCRLIRIGIEYGDYYATNIVQHGELTRFSVRGLERFDLAIRVPGLHNVRNALAATVLALSFGIQSDVIQKALLTYSGAWRRFEIKGEHRGVVVVDDYAHHPTEIRATLKAARQYFPARRIWCIFQPHTPDRTKKLFAGFVSSFSDCDQLVVTDIYHAIGRETTSKVSGRQLAAAIKKTKKEVTFIKDLKQVCATVAPQLVAGDLVITMGAGTITEVSDMLVAKLR